MSWRVGQHYKVHVYDGDRPVATFFREEDAQLAVDSVNMLLAYPVRYVTSMEDSSEHAE